MAKTLVASKTGLCSIKLVCILYQKTIGTVSDSKGCKLAATKIDIF